VKLGDWLPWLVGVGVVYLHERDRKPAGTVTLVPAQGGAVPSSGASNTENAADFENFKPVTPPGYSRMKGSDVPASIMPKLRPLLAAPLGTITKLPTDGRDIVAVIEAHFHEPGGPVKPWGWHKGVSLFERKGADA